jgi:serine/threonine protein kinase
MQECRVLQSVQSPEQPAPFIVKLVKVYGNLLQDLTTDTKRNNTTTTSSPSDYAASTHQKIHIVMELATGGNLQSRVLQHGALSEDHVKSIAVDLLYGILYLQQSHRLCHVNLQPCNVLLQNDTISPDIGKRRKSSTRNTSTNKTPGLRAVICDFGSVCRINGVVSRLPHELHTQFFAAHEIVQHQTCNAVTDMWSIGAILYFCLFGTLPPVMIGDNNDSSGNSTPRTGTWDFTFPTSMSPLSPVGHSPQRASPSSPLSQVIERLKSYPEESASPPPPPPRQDHALVPLVSRHAKQLISACMHSDPTVRLTPEEALGHPWLADVVAAKRSSIGKNGGNNNNNSSNNSNTASRQIYHHSGRSRWLGRVVPRRPWSLLCSINNNNANGRQNDNVNNKKDIDLTAATSIESSEHYQQHHQPRRRHSDQQIDRHQHYQGNHHHNGNNHASHSDGKKGNRTQPRSTTAATVANQRYHSCSSMGHH